MKTLSLKSDGAGLEAALAKCKSISPQIVLFFAAPALLNDAAALKKASDALPGVHVMGCSTAGEITSEGVSDDSFSLIAIHFDKTAIKIADVQVPAVENSKEMGKKMGEALKGNDLSGIFVLCPGTKLNGTEFTKGMSEAVGEKVVITGGLAGDGTNFTKTHTYLDGKLYTDHAVAFAMYGNKIKIKSGARGGWIPFGPARRVTKSAANILYELDGKPALQLYKEYLGEKAAGLPATGLLYPFSILREEDRKEIGIIRTVLDVNQKDGSMTLAGDMPQGCMVSLMHAGTDSLVTGAEDAADEAKCQGKPDNTATLLVSCVGRKVIMGNDTDEEVEAVIKKIGNSSAFAGFYAYGEICPFVGMKSAVLHNQTMTITTLSEEEAA